MLPEFLCLVGPIVDLIILKMNRNLLKFFAVFSYNLRALESMLYCAPFSKQILTRELK